MRKDYYRILGVGKDADDATLKRAYRKLSMQWHPDKHTNDSDADQKKASDMFADISEAYDVLSDPNKRSIYDNGGDPLNPQANQGFSGFDNPNMGEFNNIVNDFIKRGMGGNIHFDFGGGGDGFKRIQPIKVTMREAFYGCTKEVLVDGKYNVKVNIKRGTMNGDKVKFRVKSNIYEVSIIVESSGKFAFHQDKLMTILHVPYYSLILGTKFKVRIFDEENIVEIPRGTQPNDIIVMRGCGWYIRGTEERGDLLVKVLVDLTKNPSNEELELVEKIKSLHK